MLTASVCMSSLHRWKCACIIPDFTQHHAVVCHYVLFKAVRAQNRLTACNQGCAGKEALMHSSCFDKCLHFPKKTGVRAPQRALISALPKFLKLASEDKLPCSSICVGKPHVKTLKINMPLTSMLMHICMFCHRSLNGACSLWTRLEKEAGFSI